MLSCEFRTEKDQNPRIEWKKKGKTVTFVYFNGKFTGERRPGLRSRLLPVPLTVSHPDVQELTQDGRR